MRLFNYKKKKKFENRQNILQHTTTNNIQRHDKLKKYKW